MPKKTTKQNKIPEEVNDNSSKKWVKAEYHFHVFHYRMPQTVAIASINPFVPSPLTVKMALIAALLQIGDYPSAEKLALQLSKMDVLITPPSSALSFKAFMRYQSVPPSKSNKDKKGEDEDKDIKESSYSTRPHNREYAIFESPLSVYVGIPDVEILNILIKALRNIRYLGCKDSMVTCLNIELISEEELENTPVVRPMQDGYHGAVILTADIINNIRLSVKNLIPGLREEEHYILYSAILPGNILSIGRTRIFRRHKRD